MPKLVKVEDQYLKFEPMQTIINQHDLTTHYTKYRNFAIHYDIILLFEIICMIVVYGLQTIDYLDKFSVGPIDSSILESQFLSNV